MKEYYGNYIGVVITGGEKDPEHRGRCQVFVPNTMPCLYENWNKEGKDISFEVIGQGLDGELDPKIIERLRQILPWAECVAPIIGASPSYKGSIADQVSEYARNVGTAISGAVENIKDRIFGDVKDQGVDFTKDSKAWSGAFISHVAGNADTSFPRGLRHVDYASGIRDGASSNWTAIDPNLNELKPGDIVITNRGGNNITYDMFKDNKLGTGQSHGDVVVAVNGGRATLVGGNVGNKVNSVTTYSNRNSSFFTILRPKTPELAVNVINNANSELAIWQKNGWTESSPEAKQTLNAYWQSGSPGQPRPTTTSTPTKTPSEDPHPSPTIGMAPDHKSELELSSAYSQSLNQSQSLSLQGNNTNTGLDTSGTLAGSFGGGGTSTTLKIGSNNKINPEDLKNYLKSRLESSPLIQANGGKGYVPSDGAKYGIDGSANSWANYLTKLAEKESAFEPVSTYTENFKNSKGDLVLSSGLFRVSTESVRGYGIGKGLTDEQLQQKLFDPAFNIDAAIAIHEKQVLKLGKIEIGDGRGAGGYFAKASMDKIKVDVSKGKVDAFDSSAAISQPSIHTTTPHQGIAGPNTNNQALGMFGYASEGQAVWVFFREGNPLAPAYFGASYGSKEWGGIYQNASNSGGSGEPGSEIAQINLYGGGFRTGLTTEESKYGAGHSFQLYDRNGSNLTFAKDHTQFNSMYNHVSRILGDNHDIVESNKEVRVRGDYNTYAEQDIMITVGNWSQEAVDASDAIQKIINEAMEIKSKAGES